MSSITSKSQRSRHINRFLDTGVNKYVLLANAFMAIFYFYVIMFWFPKGNSILFGMLIFGEAFHLWQTLSYCFTIWETEYKAPFKKKFTPAVDVFITVAGEPTEIVEETVRAAKEMKYPNFKVYILNDGLVAKKDNWKDMEVLAKKLDVTCLTRTIPGGAKAGNINHATKNSDSPYIVIFDADHVPHTDFLQKTMGYFGDKEVAFVQSPQYYANANTNSITKGAWEQQELFFGPICKGKNRNNSTFMCGTNMIISRQALLEAGGMFEENIAEDFLTSLFIHKKGWKSVYVGEVLAEGLAPEDFLSYYKQQYRWARGSLEVIFNYNPLFTKGLSFIQKFQYLASASYYLSGIVVLINMILPLAFFFTGQVPLQISTMTLALIFLPYIFLNLYTLQLSSNFSYTFQALSFSISSFPIFLKALSGVLLRQKATFSVTSKTAVSGNFLYLCTPHIAYILLTFIGLTVAIMRDGLTASVITNMSWASLNMIVFVPFILASLPEIKRAPKVNPVFKVSNISSS